MTKYWAVFKFCNFGSDLSTFFLSRCWHISLSMVDIVLTILFHSFCGECTFKRYCEKGWEYQINVLCQPTVPSIFFWQLQAASLCMFFGVGCTTCKGNSRDRPANGGPALGVWLNMATTNYWDNPKSLYFMGHPVGWEKYPFIPMNR